MKLVRRLVCLVRGHRWRELRVNLRRWVMRGHLHPLAGKDADCDYCGARWRDYGPDLAAAIERTRARFKAIEAGLCDAPRPKTCDGVQPGRR